MKRTLSKTVAVALLLFFIAGAAACASKKISQNTETPPASSYIENDTKIFTEKSQYIGEWNATSANSSGIEVNLTAIGLEMSMSVKADGKISVSSAGESGEGTWEETDDGIKIKSDGNEIDCKFVDGKLQMFEPKSKMNICFEKQKY